MTVAARIQARICRLEAGNLGDSKRAAHGVYEVKLSFGSGYRVYFGFDGENSVILLTGEIQGTQERDIVRVQRYWLDFRSRGQHES